MSFVLFSLFAYLLGSMNGAQLLHHLFRGSYIKHITRIGTRNAGAQNVWMNIGKRQGILVFVIDFLKGYLVITLGRIFGFDGAVLIVFGAFAIAGHNWPVFFHFHGGRGFATLIGAFYAFNPDTALIASLASLPFGILRYAGLTPFVFLAVGSVIFFTTFGFPIILAYVFMALVIYIKRIYAEWVELKKSRNKIKVLKNLFIYDRAGSNPPPLRELFS